MKVVNLFCLVVTLFLSVSVSTAYAVNLGTFSFDIADCGSTITPAIIQGNVGDTFIVNNRAKTGCPVGIRDSTVIKLPVLGPFGPGFPRGLITYTIRGAGTALITDDGDPPTTLLTIRAGPAPNPTLSLTIKGKAGSVTGTPAGIDCGDSCAFSLAKGTKITLTAIPARGSKFKNWTGGVCGGNKLTCRLTLNGDKSVVANFN